MSREVKDHLSLKSLIADRLETDHVRSANQTR